MYRNVLVAVDFEHEEVGPHLVNVGRFLAGNGKVTVLHVVRPLPSYVAIEAPGDVVERYRQEAHGKLAAIAKGGVETLTSHGNPANVILDEARRLGCDAIVVGSHRPGFGDFLLGSTAAKIVRHAPCSVVVDRSFSG
jgi:nucleotide-binding universal stress UspA family protein